MQRNQQIKHLLNHILSLEVSKGHLKWRVSDLSRISGMSRPLIYYHLGNTKEQILENCLNLFTSEFYGFNSNPEKISEENIEIFIEGLVKTQKLLKEYPNLTMFYIRSRAKKSPFQKKFEDIESLYQRTLSRKFPELSQKQIVGLHALLHGIVSAPFADEQTVRSSVELVLKSLAISSGNLIKRRTLK